MANGKIINDSVYEVVGLFDTVRASYPTITANDGRIVALVSKDKSMIINLSFKTSSAITSGSVNLSGIIPAARTESYGSLCSADGKMGNATLSGTTLYIRCEASSTYYLAGQIAC